MILLAGFVLNACQSPSSPEFSSSRLHEMDSTISPKVEMEAFISPLRDSVESVMNEVFGENKQTLHPQKTGNTPVQ